MIIYGDYCEYKSDMIMVTKFTDDYNNQRIWGDIPVPIANGPDIQFAADFMVIAKDRETADLIEPLVKKMQKIIDESENRELKNENGRFPSYPPFEFADEEIKEMKLREKKRCLINDGR